MPELSQREVFTVWNGPPVLLHDSPNVLVRASRRSRSPILSGGRDPLGRRRAVIPFRRGVESETTTDEIKQTCVHPK